MRPVSFKRHRFLQMLQNLLRGLFRETALTGAADDDGNDGHPFPPCRVAKRYQTETCTNLDTGTTIRKNAHI